MNEELKERLTLLKSQLTITNDMVDAVIYTMNLFKQQTEMIQNEITVLEEELQEGAPYLND